MLRLLPAAVVLTLSLFAAAPAAAKDELLETLAQKGVLTVEEYEKLKAQRKTEVTVNTEDGFKISSYDGFNTLQVGTLQQLDFAVYKDDRADLADGTQFRRSRLSLTGIFFKDWQYRVEYEFSTSATTGVTDAYVAYTGLKPFTVQVGQFKQPFGMEALASDKNVTFMERGLPFAFITTRAPGVQFGTSGRNWSLASGVFGEPVTNAQFGDEGYGLIGRATFAPWLQGDHVIHLGVAGTFRYPTADSSTNTTGPRSAAVRFQSRPESNVLAQRLIDSGEIRNVDNFKIYGVEFAAEYGALSIQGEGHFVQVDRNTGSTFDFNGWYGQVAYTLTGEARPYRGDKGFFDGIRPAHPFGKEGWGAFEVAGRVSGLDLTNDTVIGGLERNATIALSWYLNPQLRVSANVVKVLSVDGGAFNKDKPIAFQMRFQLSL